MVTISKTYNRYTKGKVENQDIQLWKIISSQRKTEREEERNQGTTKQPEND